MTDAERRQALGAIAAEVRSCTDCRLHQTRTKAVPGEGDPDTEVVFVGEGPGEQEDRQGRPFVGASGQFLTELIGTIGWRREEVFITNVVKCRPPGNRDPLPDEIQACSRHLRHQLEVLDPAVVVTVGKFSLNSFRPGERIGRVHGTARQADPSSGARAAAVYAMYHPAFALYQSSNRQTLIDDIAGVPVALMDARRRREGGQAAVEPGVASAESASFELAVDATQSAATGESATPSVESSNNEPRQALTPARPAPDPADDATPQLTLF